MDDKNKFLRIQYNLQFFAKEGSGGEKTEDATSKKLQDARDEGQVAKSTDLVTAALLLTLFLMLKFTLPFMGNGFIETFKSVYGSISMITSDVYTVNTAQNLMLFGLKKILLISLPIFLAAIVVTLGTNIAQVKWKPTTKPLQPKLSGLNPVNGIKKMFSMEKVMDLVKSIAKLGIMSYVVYDELKEQWTLLTEVYRIPLNQAVALIGQIAIDLGVKISVIFIILAMADYVYQRRKFKKDMKMTKQEVKDEFKQAEGDPHVKGKIRTKMREVSQRRMMQALPEADVVITNPTHLAVAVKYDKDTTGAPIVIAKGADYLAEKIKVVARENQIEIVENKPLARMLFYNVDVDAEIPPELYQLVAEVLAYVYGLKGKL